jgi:mannose-1-phosphate guanylyltransferase
MQNVAIIMAGGSGERFWPLSRKNTPKQLLKLGDNEKTMLRQAIERIQPVIDITDVYIITGQHLLEPIRNELPDLPQENVIAEPAKRNTAPCLALGAAFIRAKYSHLETKEISIAVLTADHIITPTDRFVDTVNNALEFVAENQYLTTIGIVPSRTETGYGYIEIDQAHSEWTNGIAKEVVSFREKPSFEKAEEYIESGKFLWNSGMFFWRLDTFTEAMKVCLPKVGQHILTMSEKYHKHTEEALESYFEGVKEIFEAFPNISIDYGLMEKVGNAACVKSQFNWDDCGSWDAMERIMDKDDSGNLNRGKSILLESKDTILINSSEKKDMILTGFGLDNLAVIATDDAVMVCPKDRVQEVKTIVEEMKKDDDLKEKYL